MLYQGKIKHFFPLLLLLITFNTGFGQKIFRTKTGEKFHLEKCQYLKYSRIEISLNKALELGLEACLVCKPTGNKNSDQPSVNNPSSSSNSPKRTATVQCSGLTQKGTRCKRKTTNANGRCFQH